MNKFDLFGTYSNVGSPATNFYFIKEDVAKDELNKILDAKKDNFDTRVNILSRQFDIDLEKRLKNVKRKRDTLIFERKKVK